MLGISRPTVPGRSRAGDGVVRGRARLGHAVALPDLAR